MYMGLIVKGPPSQAYHQFPYEKKQLDYEK